MSLFKDQKLENYLQKMINKNILIKQDLTPKKLRSFRYLTLSYQGVESLEGIELCENLERLVLINNPIKDLSPLNDLPKLESLDLSSLEGGVPFHTLTGPLRKIEQLELRDAELKDVEWIRYFPNVKRLNLWNNNIHSIELLSQMDYLIELNLKSNPVKQTDIEALVNITGADCKFDLKRRDR